MAQGEAKNRPGEFGGVPGLYGNVDEPQKAQLKNVHGVLEPWEERMALMQSNPADPTSRPSHGSGGRQVAR